MNKQILLVFIINLMLFGCTATKLSCTPTDRLSVAQSIDVLKESLDYQSPNHKVHSVEINHDYIKIVSEPNSKISLIHFDSIGGIELHEKGEWKIVTIRSLDDSVMYRLYVKSDEVARNFIDSVYTLKNHQNEIENELKNN